MRKIKLLPSGEVQLFTFSPDTGEHRVTLNNDNILLAYNIRDIDIEGATVRTFINMFKHYPSLKCIEDFSEYCLQQSKKIRVCPPLEDKFIEVYGVVDGTVMDNQKKSHFLPAEKDGSRKMVFGEPFPSKYTDVSFYYSVSEIHKDTEETYSLTFTPLEDVIDLRVVVGNTKVVIHESIKFSKEKSENVDRLLQFEAECHPSLIELLQAIISGITFLGEDEEKELKFNELKKSIPKDRKN